MLLDRIGHFAQETPDRVAIVAGDEHVSYRDLWFRAGLLAEGLRRSGIARGDLVAVHLPRSANLLIALVGVMRCGGAYTVVEEDGNPDEHRHRLGAIGAAQVIANGPTARRLREARIAAVALEALESGAATEAERLEPLGPSDPAYVLFTSGSTGAPKGVLVNHGNIAHYATSLIARLEIADALRYAHVSTLAADLGNTCLFLCLWTGGTLHLLDSDLRRDPAGMLGYLVDHRIEFLKITPSHWKAMFQLADRKRPALRFLVLGGELLTIPFATHIWRAAVTQVLVNHYGPTETTVGVTCHVIRAEQDLLRLTSASVPIGAPFGQTRLLARDDDGAFWDRDVVGELFIGGPSVGPGYFRDATSTAASFVSDIDGDMRFYRTGDFVRIDAAGVVEFRGRIDRQVKVNGYRVELEHVETAMRGVAGIEEAAAYFLIVDGRGQLIAAARTADGRVGTLDSVKPALAAVMPAHMIPSRLFGFDAFPLNANGKTDRKALQPKVEAALAALSSNDGDGDADGILDDPQDAELRAIWRKHLGHGRFGRTDSFFDVGGDSIGAIQVISDLQITGRAISAAAFLANPTLAGLAAALSAPAALDEPNARPSRQGGDRFSPAQRDFLSVGLADPDYWNQAILLATDRPAQADRLKQALARLVDIHPLLRTAYQRTDDGGWSAHPATIPGDRILSHSRIDPGMDEAAEISRVAHGLHRAIDLASGAVFRAHLFDGEQGRSHLLLVCHHLSIDAVSWRIVLDDLDRIHAALASGQEPTIPPGRHGFWDWVDHMEESVEHLRPDLSAWDAVAKDAAEERPENVEGAARTVWLAFTRAETTRLHDAAGSRLHAALLAAFAQAYNTQAYSPQAYCPGADGGTGRDIDHLTVDVESHGRLSFDERLDPSRMVGWFTSTFPVSLPVHRRDPVATRQAVEAVFANTPHLGVAYGLAGADRSRRSRVCYNYLGDFRFAGESLGLTPSRHAPGPARGGANNRLYDLKLTARTVDGHLVADLSFSPTRESEGEMIALMRAIRQNLLAQVGVADEPPRDGRLLVEPGSSTGLLTYVPTALALEPPAPAQRTYHDILLTGATGFVGCHVLHALLARTDARIQCLVRASGGESPRHRLESVYDGYFPDTPFADHRDRVIVLQGDVSAPRLGLTEAEFATLETGLDAIYHFAADTRLFGDAALFEAQNIRPVRSLIALASSGRPKHLHCMSTLAVAGVNEGTEPAIFTEDALDIGQRFQNEYERTKFQAERLVRSFMLKGGVGFVYRSGNVSGHSRTGAFQRNAGDNRFVQFLSAVARLGALPTRVDERIALSPVDVVAAGIVDLSLNPDLSGGVFHVDSEHEIAYADIFAALRSLGFPLEPTDAPDFASLFERAARHRDPALAIALFWARRQPRNIRYDHRRTLDRLARADIRFDPPPPDWLARFLRRLVAANALPPIPIGRKDAAFRREHADLRA